jgi:Tfp pilus assembly protein PilX
MRQQPNSLSKLDRNGRHHNQRGIAMVMTLLLLLLLTAVSLTMVLSTSSDMLINGYYRNFRGAFYAADSGLNIARQSLATQISAAVPTTFSVTTQPIPTGTDAAVQTSIISTYGTSFQSLNLGSAASSWQEKYELTTVQLSPPTCIVTGATGTCTAFVGTPTGFSYSYPYRLVAVGHSQGNENATVEDRGTLLINAAITPAGASSTSVNFAAWGMFIDQYSLCGNSLVAGTISGPVFTNGSWNFNTGSYIFTDSVGSAGAQAGYEYSDGTCDSVTGASDKHSGTTIAPTFQAGFKQGQASIPLPGNSFNQETAVLNGTGGACSPAPCSPPAPTQAQMGAALRTGSGTAYPATGSVPSTGVYLPYSTSTAVCGAGKSPCMTGGGIFVQGSATSVVVKPGSTTSQQTYVIVQGGVTTTVTVDQAANTTTINGTVINGVPENDSTGTPSPATMLYVNGSINALSGPGEGKAAVQDSTALTITAANDITITGDILYKTEPVTTGGATPDTLISGNDHGQVLGIFTANGNVNLANTQSDNNLEVDASIAEISAGGSGGLINTGNAISQLTIVGGRIQNTIQNINTTTRNVWFDRRFASGNFAPPWFPSTVVSTTPPASDTAALTSSFQRTQWINETSTF